MARIIYGVAGEGFGHSSRCELIGQRLIDAGHEVKFMASQRSLLYLRQRFGQAVKEIFGLRLVYEDGTLNNTRTLACNVKAYSKGSSENRKVFREDFDPFCPDLVISDFEPFSAWWAWRHGVPCISIDHEHILSLCDLEFSPHDWTSRMVADVATRFVHPQADAYLILNFFKTSVHHSTAVLTPPVVRSVCEHFRPTQGKDILVYFTDSSETTLRRVVEVLTRFPEQRFVVYGFNRDWQINNCLLKRHSRQIFLVDLAGCKGVIGTAGFSLISECLYFNKPMLAVPMHKQFEQMTNARYLEKLGIGRRTQQLDQSSVEDFIDHLDNPRELSEDILYPDNDLFFALLQRVFNQVCPDIRINQEARSLMLTKH